MAVPDGPAHQALAPAPGLGRVPPFALVLSGIGSVQFGAGLAATLFNDIGPSGAAVLRLAWAAVLLVVLVRPRVRGRTRHELRLTVAFGLTLGLMNLTFYEALDRLPLGVAVTIEFAGPLAVAVLGSRRPLDVVWAALAALGIVLLADPFGAGGIDGTGLALVLVAAACWAGYILLAQRSGRVFAGLEGVALAMVVGALVPLGPGLAQGGADLLHPGILAAGLGVAVLSSVIPYSVETEALRRLPARVFGVLMSLEPVVAAIAGFLVLGQGLGGQDLAAIACVVAATSGAALTR